MNDLEEMLVNGAAMPVHLQSSSIATEPRTSEFGGCVTYTVPQQSIGPAVSVEPVQLVKRVKHRHKTRILLNGTNNQAIPQQGGSVTSPGAGAVIATLTLPTGGLYQINWTVGLGGTTGAADVNNFALNVGGIQYGVSNNSSTSGQNFSQLPVTIPVPSGGAVVTVTAIAAGTVASQYRATISATLTGIMAMINSKRDPLTNQTPQGASIVVPVVSVFVLDWQSQQPCYIIGISGPLQASVIDETYLVRNAED